MDHGWWVGSSAEGISDLLDLGHPSICSQSMVGCRVQPLLWASLAFLAVDND
jgi:hypothetical protein